MPIAKVFKSGNSQAIRLPKELRLSVKEVELIRQGSDILIRQPRIRSFASALETWAQMPDDFFAEGRHDVPAHKQITLEDNAVTVFVEPDLPDQTRIPAEPGEVL